MPGVIQARLLAMKLKYKNFGRLVDSGAGDIGLQGFLTYLVIALICLSLSYFIEASSSGGGVGFMFLIPGLVCLYCAIVELVVLIKFNKD